MKSNFVVHGWLVSLAALSISLAVLPNSIQAQTNCVSPPAGIVSWWRAEGDATDSSGTNQGVLENGTDFVSGKVGRAFHFDGINDRLRIPATESLNVGSGSGFTVEAWIKPADAFARPIFEWVDGTGGSGLHLWINQPGPGRLIANLVDTNGGFHLVEAPLDPLEINVYHHVALTFDRGVGLARLYLNGALVKEESVGDLIPETRYDLIIGSRPSSAFFAGAIDEFSLYRRALGTNEIKSMYDAGSAGKCVEGAPIITAQPQNQNVHPGDAATFTVVATGGLPISYQWRFNDSFLLGETNASLVIPGVQATNVGNYSVQVSNPAGSTLSSNAVLMILPPAQCAAVASGLVGWWRAEGDVIDAIGGNNGALENGATFGSGEVGQAFSFDGLNDYVMIPASPSLNVGLGNGLTVETWVRPSDSLARPIFEWGGNWGGSGAHLWVNYPTAGQLTANIVDSGGGFHLIEAPSGSIQTNVYQHVAVSYDRTSGVARLHVNGTVVREALLGGFTPQTSHAFYIGSRPSSAFFAGEIDDLSIFSRALSTNELQSIFSAGTAGKCPTDAPATIFAQPLDQTVTVGQTATFSVNAGGSPPLRFQWSLNGTPLEGATDSSLVLHDVQRSQAGNYSVLVTNATQAVASSNAVLTVNFGPAQLRLFDTQAAGGGTVTVPVLLFANGNENALGFSLNFSPALLTYAGASLGSNASGALLLLNTHQVPNGRLGVALSLPARSSFPAGRQEVVEVTFSVASALYATSTQVTFGNQPIPKELSDADAKILTATYQGGSVGIAAAQFEGDVSPRPDGDHSLSLTDWVLAGRFVAQLDNPTNAQEFQRADCAPRSTQGDGTLTVGDWVQAGRYAAGLDPVTIMGGPASEQGSNSRGPGSKILRGLLPRQLSVGQAVIINGQTGRVPISLESQGDENALGFSISFDATALTFIGATLGADAAGAILSVNANQADSGRVAFLLGLQPNSTFSAGTRELLTLDFRTTARDAGTFPVALTDQPIRREVDSATVSVLPTEFVHGSVIINPPPTLKISQSSGQITLWWPQWSSNFILQQTTSDLPGPLIWSNLPGGISITNHENTLTLPADAVKGFYRLRQP
jgi:hypothetical protein